MKQIALYAITAMLTIFAVEGMSRLGYWLYFGEAYVLEDIGTGPEAPVESRPIIPPWLSRQIVHPYFGATLPSRHLSLNQAPRTGDRQFTVAIFGGSVAFGNREDLKAVFLSHLKDIGSAAELHMAVYAVPGFKQPQQLLQLTYALSIGKKFDLIVNIDGYNEAVLSLKENYNRGVYPFFPRLWDLRISQYADSAVRAEVAGLRQRLVSLNTWFATTPLRYSAFGGLWYRILSKRTESEVRRLTKQAGGRRPLGLEKTGPRHKFDRLEAAAEAITSNWYRSSIMMSTLANHMGVEYFHFLQPNQYVDGSKVLNAEELKIAYAGKSERKKFVNLLYPMLRSKAEELRAKGVRFFDLTRIFLNTEETIYRDVCCHLNRTGNQVLAEKVLEQVLENTRFTTLNPEYD